MKNEGRGRGRQTNLRILERSAAELKIIYLFALNELNLSQHILEATRVHMVGSIDLDPHTEGSRYFFPNGANYTKCKLGSLFRRASEFVTSQVARWGQELGKQESIWFQVSGLVILGRDFYICESHVLLEFLPRRSLLVMQGLPHE